METIPNRVDRAAAAEVLARGGSTGAPATAACAIG